MDAPHDDLSHATKLKNATYYLLVSIIFGIGIYFLVQGISQFWY
jgi:hypothetical protein